MTRLILCALIFTAACGPAKTGQQDLSNKYRGKVIVFLGTDCPVSQKYASRLNEYYKKYSDKFVWITKIPQDLKQSELNKFVEEYEIIFPVSLDREFKTAEQYNATVTPEVIVINLKDSVIYKGAIDNWFYDLGKYRQQTTEDYLDSALTSVLDSRVPYKQRTEPVGCPIPKKKTPR